MPEIPSGFGQATINFTGMNVPRGAAIVMGYEQTADPTALEDAERMFNATALSVPDLCTTDVTLTSVDVKQGPNSTGAIATFTGTPVVGASGSTSLSPGTAVLGEKQTALGGRRGRGRCYWPGVYDGWVNDDGTYVGGVQAQINGFLEEWRAAMIVAGVPPVLLHSPSYTWELQNGQPRRVYGSFVGLPVPTPVTSIVCDPQIATQRRRLR